MNIEYMWRNSPLRLEKQNQLTLTQQKIIQKTSPVIWWLYTSQHLSKDIKKQIPSNIEYICWMYNSQKQFQKERPANIEYIWWMFPWEGSSFPVSLTMATSANGHNLTVTFRHILIFYIWNFEKSRQWFLNTYWSLKYETEGNLM